MNRDNIFMRKSSIIKIFTICATGASIVTSLPHTAAGTRRSIS